MNVATKGMP